MTHDFFLYRDFELLYFLWLVVCQLLTRIESTFSSLNGFHRLLYIIVQLFVCYGVLLFSVS